MILMKMCALADKVSNFLIKDIASWPPPIATQALDSGIPIKFLDTSDDNYLHRFVKSFDYLVCAGCPRVPASLVHSMPNRILNAHPGLLPWVLGGWIPFYGLWIIVALWVPRFILFQRA